MQSSSDGTSYRRTLEPCLHVLVLEGSIPSAPTCRMADPMETYASAAFAALSPGGILLLTVRADKQAMAKALAVGFSCELHSRVQHPHAYACGAREDQPIEKGCSVLKCVKPGAVVHQPTVNIQERTRPPARSTDGSGSWWSVVVRDIRLAFAVWLVWLLCLCCFLT